MVEIRKVKWGVANYYNNPDRIEINEILYEPQFDSVRSKIIQHELDHHKMKSKGFWKQREIDMKTNITLKDLIPIYKRKPSLFIQQHSPITYIDKTLMFEWSLIFLYSIYIGLGLFIYYLIRLFSKDNIFFWEVIKYTILLLIICLVLYYIGKFLRRYINEQADKN